MAWFLTKPLFVYRPNATPYETLINRSGLLFFLLPMFSLVACKKHDFDVVVRGETKVKMINAALTASSQDIYINGQKLSTSALAFSERTEYLKISSGSMALKFIGSSNLATESTFNFTPSIYLFYIFG